MDIILPELCGSEDNFFLERFLYSKGLLRVAGCDEVGRGPLAGPVVAACVVLPPHCDPTPFVDSKAVSHRRRLELLDLLNEIGASYGIGMVSHKKIDQINILQASLLAMARAVAELQSDQPDYVFIDGKFTIPLAIMPEGGPPIGQTALIKGESKSGSIAAASIVAKVERDQMMTAYHQKYPVYNFAKNKGYPTKEHRMAISHFGICSIHRRTFRGVKDSIE